MQCLYIPGDTSIISILNTPTKGVIEDLQKKYPGCRVTDLDEAIIQIDEANDKKLINPWEEINLEAWEEALCCLPPENWKTVRGVEFFRMCEYWTDNITAHYARLNDKFYTALRRTNVSYEVLADEISQITN